MKPEQEARINAAIAKHEGWKLLTHPKSGFKYWNKNQEPPDYTASLDAIVPVVKRWCEENNATLHLNYWLPEKHFTVGIGWQNSDRGVARSSKQPALAMCLAFVKAAGLKGDWNE